MATGEQSGTGKVLKIIGAVRFENSQSSASGEGRQHQRLRRFLIYTIISNTFFKSVFSEKII